jgi:putative ABC transport system permease protein
MYRFYKIWWNILRKERLDEELDQEVRSYLDLVTEDKMHAGISREEAMTQARREMGGMEEVKESVRDIRMGAAVEACLQDVRYGLRLLLRNPGFSSVAILTLALGIGSTAVLFSILDGAYIHFGQTPQANRVVLLNQRFTKDKSVSTAFSAPEYFDIARLCRSFDGVFALHHSNATLAENVERPESPARVPIVEITANVFSLYGISPILGRVFTASEDRPGRPKVAVVTYRLWNGRFGCNPALVGKTIKLDGIPYMVIGITPRRFQQWGADIYTPLGLDTGANDRANRRLTVAGVAKEGVSAEQTRPELEYLAHRVEAEYGGAYPEYAGLLYLPYDVRTTVVGDLRIALYLLLGAVGMLALITSANIAALLLARAKARAGEIGTRLALGATPFRLARQFLTESVLLAVIAGALGFLLGMWALHPILALIPAQYIGEEAEIHATAAAFAVSISVAVAMGVLFGLAPALFISRRGVAANLRENRTRSVTDSRAGRLRGLLVLVEMTLAFVVIVSAGLMVRTYRQLMSMYLGFRPDHVLTLRIALPELKYRGETEVTNFFSELMRRAEALPGVTSVAASSVRPMEGSALRSFSIPGRPQRATTAYRVITPSYFTTIGTPLVAGRFPSEQDGPVAPNVAIVNERFARLYFPGQPPLGKLVHLDENHDLHGITVEIVGVVKDSRQIASRRVQDLSYPALPEIYIPFRQREGDGRDMALLLRTRSAPELLADPVRRQVSAIDHEQSLYEIRTLRELADVALGPTRLCLLLLGIFAGTALITACVGLYAIVSYSVAQRTHEAGIRMALGARPADVVRLMTREAIPVITAGLLLGMGISLGVTRLMSRLLYGVPANDETTLICVTVILATTGLAAIYIPVRRVTRVDPMAALRSE